MDLSNIEIAFAKMQFGAKSRAMMYRKIAAYSKQGTPVFNTVEMFANAYGEKKRSDPRAAVLREWLIGMNNGLSFSESIRGYVPEAEAMLIAAGQANGNLADGMAKAVFVTEASIKIRSALIGGLAYSVLLIVTLMTMIAMFSVYVIPQVASIMPVENWPPLSKQLYDTSVFVKDYGAMLALIFIVLLAVSMKTLGTFSGPMRKYFDKAPPWNIYKAIQGSVFLITLSSMMNAGIPLNNALIKIRELSAPYISLFLSDMIEALAGGAQNGEALDVGLLDDDTALDIRLLGQTADFQSSMSMIGEQAIVDTVEKIKIITSMIGIAVLFLIAGFIIFVYGGFFALTQAIAESAQAIR